MNTTREQTIEGWVGIADYLAAHAPVSVTVDSAMRWARRPEDPLPVRRWGQVRPRVYAIAAELDAWLERQNGDGGER
jgi:hypothetical protein